MTQTDRDNVKTAIKAYYEGLGLLVAKPYSWQIWPSVVAPKEDNDVIFGEDIVRLVASTYFGEVTQRKKPIPVSTYRTALEAFRLIHTNTERVYRYKVLEDLGATVRFTRGKQRKR